MRSKSRKLRKKTRICTKGVSLKQHKTDISVENDALNVLQKIFWGTKIKQNVLSTDIRKPYCSSVLASKGEIGTVN